MDGPFGGQRHGGAAVPPGVGGSRHGVRSRVEGHCQSRVDGRGTAAGSHDAEEGVKAMDEATIRSPIRDVKAGRLTRRRFVQIMVGFGLTAPMAAQMLAASGVAAQPKAATLALTPTKRGGGGPLKVLWWQSPTLLNPHFATGGKDQDGSRIFYEPLAPPDPAATPPPRSPPRTRAWTTAGSPRTAPGSPGTSRRACNGTMVSRSRPTTWFSTGSTRLTRPRGR